MTTFRKLPIIAPKAKKTIRKKNQSGEKVLKAKSRCMSVYCWREIRAQERECV